MEIGILLSELLIRFLLFPCANALRQIFESSAEPSPLSTRREMEPQMCANELPTFINFLNLGEIDDACWLIKVLLSSGLMRMKRRNNNRKNPIKAAIGPTKKRAMERRRKARASQSTTPSLRMKNERIHPSPRLCIVLLYCASELL